MDTRCRPRDSPVACISPGKSLATMIWAEKCGLATVLWGDVRMVQYEDSTLLADCTCLAESLVHGKDVSDRQAAGWLARLVQ